MTDRIPPPDPQEAEALLANLFEEVKKWEGTLAGGTRLGIGAATIESLKQTRVSFGNPRDRLILLTEETFKDTGVGLISIFRQQMRDQYDFYYVTVPVNLRPEPSVQFRQLCCDFVFGPKGNNEPIIQAIFPKSEWRTVMSWGTSMNLALNENLEWSIGVDASKLAEIANLPGNLKANVAGENKLKAFIVVPDYAYEVGRFEITAQGEGSSDCYWYIQKPDLQKMTTVQFAIVFKVPKGTESISLHGITWAEPDMNWLTADIRDVFEALPGKFKSLLRDKETAARKIPPAAREKWTLNLPKAASAS
jgi:hypothetical protein